MRFGHDFCGFDTDFVDLGTVSGTQEGLFFLKGGDFLELGT